MSTFESKLDKLIEGLEHDLAEMAPAGSDLGYNRWVEELRDEKGVRAWVAVIDFGDLHSAVYEWDGADWHQTTRFGDPYDVEERILRARR